MDMTPTSSTLAIRSAASHLASFEREPGVTAIRVENHMALVSVRFLSEIPERRLKLLQTLALARVPVNQVKLLPEGLCFVISENHASACRKLLDNEKGEVSVLGDMALISTIAGAMRDLSGVIAQICEALLSAAIPNRQVGDAYDAVLCLVPSDDAPRAVVALKQQFHLTNEEQA
jgi:aspartokinase